MPDPLFPDAALHARIRELEAERDELRAAVERVRELHTIDGHGPGWAGTEPVDAHAWCEGCEAGGLDDDGQCPTLTALEGQVPADA